MNTSHAGIADISEVNGSFNKGVAVNKSIRNHAAATLLALTSVQMAEAGVVILPIGVNSINLSGVFYGPTSTGGNGTYLLFDDKDTAFDGQAILGTPVQGQNYSLILQAMRDTGEEISLIMSYSNLQFTTSQSFEAVITNPLPTINSIQNTPVAIGSWDNSGYGDVSTNLGNATITSAVPEPSSGALAALGLSGALGLAALRRKSAPGATPGEEKPETPAV